MVTILVRDGLETMTPNQAIGDVVTQGTYRVERDGGIKEEEEDKRRRVLHSGPAPHPRARASQRKKYQVMMRKQVTLMMSS